jgi:hypothetical protein
MTSGTHRRVLETEERFKSASGSSCLQYHGDTANTPAAALIKKTATKKTMIMPRRRWRQTVQTPMINPRRTNTKKAISAPFEYGRFKTSFSAENTFLPGSCQCTNAHNALSIFTNNRDFSAKVSGHLTKKRPHDCAGRAS